MSPGLNKDMNLIIQVRLIASGNDEPISGDSFKVRLYDKDFFNDDYLGESPVQNGLAKFTLAQRDFNAPGKLDEKPDFYFVVYQNGQLIFKSKVMTNLDITDMEQFIMSEGELVDLGTFLIDVDFGMRSNKF